MSRYPSYSPRFDWRFASLKEKFEERLVASDEEGADTAVAPDEIISPKKAKRNLYGPIDAADVIVDSDYFGVADLESVLADIAARLEALECAAAWIYHEQDRSG